ncbi:hypothetical protein M8C21_014272 [Ambrosia artemisiifolia]|uniref:Uncharacterized protein n=1 Tax=Ambrosia artemisiifolia TaxID=4212 RepID=A0AAD5C176_AMBAR|nr:hypothetical protein M8C21_014272 [Ambrosia artemisiifolia]
MAEERDTSVIRFHESEPVGLPWLPTYILNDSVDTCADYGEDDYRLFSKEREHNYNHRQQPPSGRKSRAATQPPLLPSPPNWKNHSKLDQKTRNHTNWATGGPGMQAVFLASGQRSGGTGVFLPRTAGTDNEKPRKPEHNNNVKGLEFDRIRTKKNKDMSSQTCFISQNRSSSPEIFLPKEWTY